jgi:hypothetical protein
VKESSVFTHKCNVDAREDAAGAITISTRKFEINSLNCTYKTKIISTIFSTRRQVVRSGQLCLMREVGIFTEIRRTIRILRKIPNPQYACHTIERNCLDVAVYSALQKRYFLPDFSIIIEKVLCKGGGDY